MVVNSHKITTRSRSFAKHADQRNQIGIAASAAAAAVNIGSDENQSYIHDTLLNDFNQYGQFRIWYVWGHFGSVPSRLVQFGYSLSLYIYIQTFLCEFFVFVSKLFF